MLYWGGKCFSELLKKVYIIYKLHTHTDVYTVYVYSHPIFKWGSKMNSISANIFSGGRLETAAFLIVAGALTFISILSAPPSHSWQNAKMLSMFNCGMSGKYFEAEKVDAATSARQKRCTIYFTGVVHHRWWFCFFFISLNRMDMEEVCPELGHGEKTPFPHHYRGIWRGDPIGIWTWFSPQAQHDQKESMGVSVFLRSSNTSFRDMGISEK